MVMTEQHLPTRFWAKVDKTDTCWLWTAATTRGYGVVKVKGRNLYAHRVAYEMLVGPIPEGLVIDHLCRVSTCVNPDHLEPVTIGENTRRGMAPESARNRHKDKTHCLRGHEYTPETVRISSPNGHRHCRICERAFSKEKGLRVTAERRAAKAAQLASESAA